MTDDKEKYAAAVMLDGYLKAKRDELPEPMQRFIYIGIREIIKNISPVFKKQKEEELKVIISTESDWIRFQSVKERKGKEKNVWRELTQEKEWKRYLTS